MFYDKGELINIQITKHGLFAARTRSLPGCQTAKVAVWPSGRASLITYYSACYPVYLLQYPQHVGGIRNADIPAQAGSVLRLIGP